MNRLLLCAIVCCLFACNNLSKRLDLIEAQLWDDPASALAALQDSSLSFYDASDKDKARLALLTSIALDKNYIDITSDSIIHVALDYYRDGKDNRHKMLAWYYSGIVHKNAGNIQEAVIDFEQAGKYSVETSDLFYNGLINWRMGDLFSMTNNNSQSIEYYKSAVQNFAEIDAEAYLNYAQLALAQCLANARLFHEADSLTNAIKESVNDIYLEDRLRLLRAQILLELNDSSSKIQNLYDNVPLGAYEMLDYSMRGIAFERNGQPDSADVWIGLAYQHATDWADSASIDVQKAWIAHRRKNFEAAYDLLKNAIQAQDSLTRIVLQQSISTRQRDFYRNETAEKEHSLRRLHQIILLAVLAIAFAFSVIVLLFIISTQKKNQKLKDQMATLLVSQRDLLQAQKNNAMLSGSLFRDKFLQLNQISAKYFDSDDENNKEVVFQTFKKNLRDLQSNETLFELLEQDLDRYCDNIMTKIKSQVPSITGQNLHILALFFSGAPYRVVQLISGAQSIEALKTKRSRFRKSIIDANAADSTLFLSMLDMKKATTRDTK